MEDPVDELENEEYLDLGYGEEEVNQGQGKIRKILNGGLWIGKKLVITGFFVSSAPVVLPPLLVMSAFGFAVSIPFGVVLAGYTCTEKLMNKLLPLPPSSGMLDYQEQGPGITKDVDEEEEEGRFAIEEEKKQIQDTEESVEMRIELVEDGNNEEQQQENIRPEMDQNKPEVLLEEPVIVTRVVVAKPVEGETETSSGKNEEREVLKAESTGLLEKIRDETQSGESAKKNNKKKRVKKSLGLIGGKKEDKIDTKNTEQTEKIPEILHKNLNNSTLTTGKTDEISPDEQINRNIEISDVPDESQNIITNGNRSEEITGDQVPNKPETAATKGTNSEISSSEKSLWEQINALRIIVGYKIEHHPTLTEELKALYVFTGVEPPSSFKDFSDIKDFQEKLRFLMSIVGVK